jgi:hypothetical protein
MLQQACKAAIEGFTGGEKTESKRDAYVSFLAVLFAFIISFIVLGFVGKLIWNGVVVDLISFAKPAKSFWQIIGLMIFISLIHP